MISMLALAISSVALAQPVDNNQARYAGTASGQWSAKGAPVVGPADGSCANMGAVDKVNLVSNFGFNIPGSATITGATANIKAGSSGGQDIGVQLATNAQNDPPTTVGGQLSLATFNAGQGNCASTQVTSIGTTLASWGPPTPTLAPADVNNATFGLVFTKLVTSEVKVDSVCLEIAYTTEAGPATQESCFQEPIGNTITVVKSVVGDAPGSDWDFSGTLGVFTLPAAGGFETFSNVDDGDYNIAETTKDGYTASVQCRINDIIVANGTDSVTVNVTGGETATCTFTNRQDVTGSQARFVIHKTWNQDGDTDDIPVDALLDCTGADTTKIPVTFTATTDAILFVYDIDLAGGPVDCTITETVPSHYTASYDVGACGAIQCLDSDNSFAGCKYNDVFGAGDSECFITNTPDPATVEVNKSWVIEGADQGFDGDYEIWLSCDSQVTGPGSEWSFFGTWYANFFGNADDGDEDLTFTVVKPNYPFTNCVVSEENDDSVVETSNSCSDSLDLPAGGSASCDVVNTVFFEGIPTLNQYGMAILALLMLGVGLVGFRRFV